MLQYTYENPGKTTKLPVDYPPTMIEYVIDLGHKFNTDEIKRLTDYMLQMMFFKASLEGKLDINEYNYEIGKLKQKLGSERGSLSKNMDKIQKVTVDEKLLDKYSEAIQISWWV